MTRISAISDEKSANGSDAASLYTKLEETVLPQYYKDQSGWITVMKNTICKNASFFINSHRMIRQYVGEAEYFGRGIHEGLI